MMNLASGYRPNSNQTMRQTVELYEDYVFVLKLSNLRILSVILKALFLVIFVLSLHSFDKTPSNSNVILPMVFEDLANEGLYKHGQKGLVLNSGIGDLFDSFWFLKDKGIDLVTDLDSTRQKVIPDEMFDFVVASSLENAELVNKLVKVDGIVVMLLVNCYDTCYEFLKQSNYKIVYLCRFDLITVMAMRKIDGEGEEDVFSG